MSTPTSPPSRKEPAHPETAELREATVDDEEEEEVTDVMDRQDLPDFGVEESNDKPRTPRNRPSTFTRLLLDKRQT